MPYRHRGPVYRLWYPNRELGGTCPWAKFNTSLPVSLGWLSTQHPSTVVAPPTPPRLRVRASRAIWCRVTTLLRRASPRLWKPNKTPRAALARLLSLDWEGAASWRFRDAFGFHIRAGDDSPPWDQGSGGAPPLTRTYQNSIGHASLHPHWLYLARLNRGEVFVLSPAVRQTTSPNVVAAWRVPGLLTLRPRKGGETNDGTGLGQDSRSWNPVHAVLYK